MSSYLSSGTANPWRTSLRKDPQVSVARVYAFSYWGLPLGIGHFASMVARRPPHSMLCLPRSKSLHRSFMLTSSVSKALWLGCWRAGWHSPSSRRCAERLKPRLSASNRVTGR